MESLLLQIVIISMACNLVHCFDTSSPSPQPGVNSFSYPPGFSEPPSKSLSGGLANARKLSRDSKVEIHSVIHSKKKGSQLKKICSQTDYPDLCVSTISPRLKGGNADIKAILDVAIQASYELAKVGNANAKKLAVATKDDKASHIKDCQDSFDDTLSNFDSAILAFQNSDVGTMNSMLSAVLTDMSDCDDDLVGTGSQLIEIGDKLSNMTSNCLAIISQMQ